MTGKKVSPDDQIFKSLVEFEEIVGRQSLTATFYEMIPFASHLPSQFNRDIKRAVEIGETLLFPVFQAHLETFQPNVIRDLTDSCISVFKKEKSKHDGKDVGSVETVPGLMIDFISAGSELTLSSLLWFMLYMVVHKMSKKKSIRIFIRSLEKIVIPSGMIYRTCRTFKPHFAKF